MLSLLQRIVNKGYTVIIQLWKYIYFLKNIPYVDIFQLQTAIGIQIKNSILTINSYLTSCKFLSYS